MRKVIILRSSLIYHDSRVTKLINELNKLNFDITVFCWNRNCDNLDIYNNFFSSSVKVETYNKKCSFGGGMKNIFKMIGFQKWLKSKVKNFEQNSIVHACDFDTIFPIFRICLKKHIEVVYDIFDSYCDCHNLPFPLEKIIRAKDKNIIANADHVIICTEQRVKQLMGVKPKDLVVVHNTPVIENVKPVNLRDDKRLNVAFIGCLGYDRLITEILENGAGNSLINFYFGGFGPCLEKIKKYEKIYDNIIYLGEMKYQDVLNFESACDILFATYNPKIPNHRFSAPNKFYEAAALSKPIIVCKNTGIDEIVLEHQTGFVINYSAEELICLLEKISKNKDLIANYGKNGKECYDKIYSWKIMEERIAKIYSNSK